MENRFNAIFLIFGLGLLGILLYVSVSMNQMNEAVITGNLVKCTAGNTIECSHGKIVCCNGYKYCDKCGGSLTLDPDTCSCVTNTAALNVYSFPNGANVYANGMKKGQTPLQLSAMKPGSYDIRWSKVGYVDDTKTIILNAGKILNLNSNLVSVGAGSLRVMTSPNGAAVYYDGEFKGQTTVLAENLIPGKHSIRIAKEGYKEYNGIIDIGRDKETKLNILLNKK